MSTDNWAIGDDVSLVTDSQVRAAKAAQEAQRVNVGGEQRHLCFRCRLWSTQATAISVEPLD